ncbi:hypothetical protein INN71_03960 [Nocardioides sp. ChNu-153]|uniref:hypothetical protein n=1 Tax=unclassified Nocardioides TaxID=2615069 RepID=UPI002404F3DE|nr:MULTISPECIES: hypothetical protein [unclassified Nocardioides]MDF9716611.1 hypothetical protein [Nocardioides sp. ChNu-99]MDN7120544.1 hypothetical protein [Nocardioides sp. ChNu-153]
MENTTMTWKASELAGVGTSACTRRHLTLGGEAGRVAGLRLRAYDAIRGAVAPAAAPRGFAFPETPAWSPPV